MRREMRMKYLPVVAPVVGFANAYFAFQLNSLLFGLVPLWAFVFGYFTSRKTGLLSGFLLFLGYSAVTSVVMYGTPFEVVGYIGSFVLGGFLLCLIGYGAPAVKRLRSFKAAGVLVVLALSVFYSGFISFPRYDYYYQVIIDASENLDDLELYLPMVAISQEPNTEIFGHPLPETGVGLTKDYSLAIVNTEHGKMLRLGIPGLREKFRPQTPAPVEGQPAPPKPPALVGDLPAEYNLPYSGNVIFNMGGQPESLEFLPKYDATEVREVLFQRFSGPFLRGRSTDVVEKFRVPLKVSAGKPAKVLIKVESRSSRSTGFNFGYYKGETYSERFRVLILASNGWIFADGEARRSTDLSGFGD